VESVYARLMSELKNKPLSQWSLEDLQLIVEQEWEESADFEIKRELPLSKGSQGWSDKKKLHRTEREGLAQEIVAFANGRGGLLIIGLEESADNPKRAIRLASPLSNIHALKDSLSRALSATIDPPIRMIEYHVIEAAKDEGFLLIRVPQSSSAPHGFDSPPKCYVRERDESKPMTMRDLQATFWESRTRLERRDILRNEKREQWKILPKRQSSVSYRITAIPELEFPLFGLHRRIHTGDFLVTGNQIAERSAAPAAEWPFCNRDWSSDANCVRKSFHRPNSSFQRGYWEIDVSGAVSIVGEVSLGSHTESEPVIYLHWLRATLADLLALAHVVAADHGASNSRWWIDGDAQSNPNTARIFYGNNQSERVNLSNGKHFRPVPITLSTEIEGVEHVDDALSSMLCVPSLRPGKAIASDFQLNLVDLDLI